jgi:hypothetical protein
VPASQNKAEMSFLRNSPQTDRDMAGGTVFPIASDYPPENAHMAISRKSRTDFGLTPQDWVNRTRSWLRAGPMNPFFWSISVVEA